MDTLESVLSNRLLLIALLIGIYFLSRKYISRIFQSHLFGKAILTILGIFLIVSFFYGIQAIMRDFGVIQVPLITVVAFNTVFTFIMIPVSKPPVSGSFADKTIRDFRWWILCLVILFLLEVVTLSAIESKEIEVWKGLFNLSHLIFAIIFGYFFVAGIKMRRTPHNNTIPSDTGVVTPTELVHENQIKPETPQPNRDVIQ